MPSMPASTILQKIGVGLADVLAYSIEHDVKHRNPGLWSAQHSAQGHNLWHKIVETAMLQQGTIHDSDDGDL